MGEIKSLNFHYYCSSFKGEKMKNLRVVAYLCIVFAGALISEVGSVLPIDLIRVVILMPSTPVLSTPSVSWTVFLMSVGVLLLSGYIGLPRNPSPKPLRRRRDSSSLGIRGLLPQTPNHYTTALDMFAQLDANDCFHRFLCQVGATPSEERTFMQDVIYDFIKTTGSAASPWNLTDSSPRKSLIDALNFGQTSKCYNCCPTLYHSCPLTQQQLLLL